MLKSVNVDQSMQAQEFFSLTDIELIQNAAVIDGELLCAHKGVIKLLYKDQSEKKSLLIADIKSNNQLLNFDEYLLKIYSNGILVVDTVCNPELLRVSIELLIGNGDIYLYFEIFTNNSKQKKLLLKDTAIGIFFKPIQIERIKHSDLLSKQIDSCINFASILGLDGVYLSHPKVMQFKNAVIDALNKQIPFSCVRVGDGEGRLLGYPFVFSDFDISYEVLNYQFGGASTDLMTANYSKYILCDQIKLLRQLIVDALVSADYIGIPVADFFRSVRQSSFKDLHGAMGYVVGFQESLLIRKDLDSSQILGTNIFQLLCTHTNFLLIILQASRRVFYINDKNMDISFKLLNIDKPFIHIPVPSHSTWSMDKSLYGQFPFQYKFICSQISEYGHLGGDLFLIGAGILGKHYANYVKRNGGVGLDIGSVFDSWMMDGLPYAVNNEVPTIENIQKRDLEQFVATEDVTGKIG
jgi:hypothetical protein